MPGFEIVKNKEEFAVEVYCEECEFYRRTFKEGSAVADAITHFEKSGHHTLVSIEKRSLVVHRVL